MQEFSCPHLSPLGGLYRVLLFVSFGRDRDSPYSVNRDRTLTGPKADRQKAEKPRSGRVFVCFLNSHYCARCAIGMWHK